MGVYPDRARPCSLQNIAGMIHYIISVQLTPELPSHNWVIKFVFASRLCGQVMFSYCLCVCVCLCMSVWIITFE